MIRVNPDSGIFWTRFLGILNFPGKNQISRTCGFPREKQNFPKLWFFNGKTKVSEFCFFLGKFKDFCGCKGSFRKQIHPKWLEDRPRDLIHVSYDKSRTSRSGSKSGSDSGSNLRMSRTANLALVLGTDLD